MSPPPGGDGSVLRAGAVTDVGRTRQINQDAPLVADELQLWAVADGMGGHQGGEAQARGRESRGGRDGRRCRSLPLGIVEAVLRLVPAEWADRHLPERPPDGERRRRCRPQQPS